MTMVLGAGMLLALEAQAQVRDWENPAVLGINKLPYHATLQLPSREKECKEIVSLDGQWLFHWSRNPEERPARASGVRLQCLAIGRRRAMVHLFILI